MKTIKTSELIDSALDWAVCVANGETRKEYLANPYPYSTNWVFGGPIIAREKISVRWDDMTLYGQRQNRWLAECEGLGYAVDADTPLIAAMRCYVASKLGDTIEVPEELL